MISGITIDKLHSIHWTSIEIATDTVAILNADPDDDWTYEVRIHPTKSNHAAIVVFDETGAEIGTL